MITLAEVTAINVALSGDNAIVVGMAAAGLPEAQRRRAIAVGIAAASILRIIFALFIVHLLHVVGLTLAGGLLLLWICWKFWREIRAGHAQREEEAEKALEDDPTAAVVPGKTLRQAVTQIIIADISMSLDNVLAVAGAAQQETWVMVVGLALSIVLMALAATLIARLLHKYHWISYIGLLIIVYVALKMIWDGSSEVIHAGFA
jgi:YjbE family integral membrane protein